MLNRGFGVITGSSFYTPQANLPGSMASFYLPAAVPARAPAAPVRKPGLGQFDSGDSPDIGQAILSGIMEAYLPWIVGGVVLIFLVSR